MTYDAVIVGGGFAGLTAANHCPGGIEDDGAGGRNPDLYMCNSGLPQVRFMSRSVVRKIRRMNFSIPLWPKPMVLREKLLRGHDRNAQATIDWMRDEGCEFMQHPRRSWGMPMMMPGREMRAGLDWENSGPNLCLKSLTQKLEKRGGNLRRGVRVSGLLTDDGRVVGVEIEGGETIDASAVIIADGGFQADRELIGHHITGSPDSLRQRNTETGRGDGIRMAIAVGAETVGLDKFYGHVLGRDALTNEHLWPYPQLDVICAKGIVVTTDGRRFADEGQGGIYVTNAIAALDDPLSATAVFVEP